MVESNTNTDKVDNQIIDQEYEFNDHVVNTMAFSRRRISLSVQMQSIMNRQIDDIRERILNYEVMPNRNTQRFNYDDIPDHIDILLFGPAGAGKTSLIKTFYRALHLHQPIPQNLKELLTVKQKNQNEGTTKFTKVVLKPYDALMEEPTKDKNKKSTKDSKDATYLQKDHLILIHDTRGQIWMDEREKAQLNQIIDGKVKDKSMVEQRNFRYAYLLWEFWKRENELFPPEIIAGDSGLRTRPHCIVFVFDGSMDDIPNSAEEIVFYKDIINRARERKYFYPQIVLTCIDKVEARIQEDAMEIYGRKLNEFDKEQKLRDTIDMKIEKVVLNLGISRSSVHFVENYKVDENPNDEQDKLLANEDSQNSLAINYRAMKLLHECIQQAEQFLTSNLKERRSGCNVL